MADHEKYLKLSLLVIVFSCLLLPSGLAYPAEENPVEAAEPLAYHMSGADKFHPVEVSRLAENEKPKSCFHFFVSRNMSSLLSDATKMLQQVRDRREREWILTFIYRIKALAEHLRKHPESRNYDCLPGEDVNKLKDSILNDPVKNPQQELYFVDESWPSSLQKRTDTSHQSDETESQPADNQSSHPHSTGAWHKESISDVSPDQEGESVPSVSEVPSSSVAGSASSKPETAGKLVNSIPTSESAVVTHPELNQQEKYDAHQEPEEDKATTESNGDSSSIGKQPLDNGIVLSFSPDCSSSLECEKAFKRHAAASSRTEKRPDQVDDALVQQFYSYDKNVEDDLNQQKFLKERIRKALLEEMAPEVKKLRTVGGSEEDLINLWKQSESELDKSTKTHHDREFDYEEIGAAAGDLSSSDSYTTNDHTVAPSLSDVKNFKRQSNSGTKAYEPYDDSDVLVQQLFEVRFEQAPSKTTKSLSDQREEYLITSTQVPF